VLWKVMPHRWVIDSRRFEGSLRLQLRDLKSLEDEGIKMLQNAANY